MMLSATYVQASLNVIKSTWKPWSCSTNLFPSASPDVGPCLSPPGEGSDFTLLRERLCISLSINTCGLDWTYLESLAVNEREREVTRLYRPIIICQQGNCSRLREQGQHLVFHTLREAAIDTTQAALGPSRIDSNSRHDCARTTDTLIKIPFLYEPGCLE